MSKISSLNYPKKSHRKLVLLPKKSVLLAEFFGIMMGDGGINNPWQSNISLNAIKDRNYADYIIKNCQNLFGITPSLRKRKTSQTIIISLSSMTIVDFLVSNGLLRGNKLKNGLVIPEWILSKKSYRIACVRGLMDTDGSLFVHNHIVSGKKYTNLGLCFSNSSLDLIEQVADIFKENKIKPHIEGWGKKIYLYKIDDIIRYLKIFGTSNIRISSVYGNWKIARVV